MTLGYIAIGIALSSLSASTYAADPTVSSSIRTAVATTSSVGVGAVTPGAVTPVSSTVSAGTAIVNTAVHPVVSTWQEEAAISDPNVECTYYSYAPVQAIKNTFPTIWTIAQLVPGDIAAQELFLQINSTVPPNIGPKGTPQGDFSAFTPTYTNGDTDCWWSYSKCTTPKYPGLDADVTECPIPDTLTYGFDDGPNCTHNAFYDYMKSKNQLATLFYIGSNVLDWPLEAIRGHAEGHQICVHTWSHRYMTALSNEQVFSELYYTLKAIKQIIGVTPKCWRPPYGDVDDRIRAFAKGLGLRNIVWKYDTFDWKINVLNKTTIDANYQDYINGGLNGSYSTRTPIVLMHELNNFTMNETVSYYSSFQKAFKYIVPLASCLNDTHPYAENDQSFPNFADYVNSRGSQNIASGMNYYETYTYSNPLMFSASPLASSEASIFTNTPGATATQSVINAVSTTKANAALNTVSRSNFLVITAAVFLGSLLL